METPRALVARWLKDGSSLLAQLLQDYSRATAALEEVKRECAKLQEQLAALREENDRFRKERSEALDTIAAALGTASAALRRFPDAPAVVTVTPVTAGDVPPAPVDAGVATPAPASTSAPVASAPREPPPQRILVVDDDESFRSLVASHLGSNRGYEVTTAESGEEALRLLASSPPQLVLLDLTMPGIGGMHVLRHIKALYPDLCVLMVTAHDDRATAQEALALGAADYVKKPFDLDYLDAVLQIYMTVSDAPPGTVGSAMAAAEQHKVVSPPSPPTKSPFVRH